MKLPLIYVAHPFGGKKFLLERAESWVAQLNKNFDALFFAPWIPQCRHWANEGESLIAGLTLNEQAICRSDAVILVGGCVSPGMAKEALFSQANRVQVFDLSAFVTCVELMRIETAVRSLRDSISFLVA